MSPSLSASGLPADLPRLIMYGELVSTQFIYLFPMDRLKQQNRGDVTFNVYASRLSLRGSVNQ